MSAAKKAAVPRSGSATSVGKKADKAAASAKSGDNDSEASGRSGGGSKKKQSVSYAAEKAVGNGSFGTVYQATVLETGETVAIKRVLQDRRFKVQRAARSERVPAASAAGRVGWLGGCGSVAVTRARTEPRAANHAIPGPSQCGWTQAQLPRARRQGA
jgi:hypothetical protein